MSDIHNGMEINKNRVLLCIYAIEWGNQSSSLLSTYHDEMPSSNRVLITYVYYGEKGPSVTRPLPYTWNDIKQKLDPCHVHVSWSETKLRWGLLWTTGSHHEDINRMRTWISHSAVLICIIKRNHN